MKKKYSIILSFALLIAVGVGTYFDTGLYKNPIMVVQDVKQIDSIPIDEDGNRQITQSISGTILNRNMKTKKVTNQYSTSQMTDFKVRKGQQLILSSNSKTILNIKKDYIVTSGLMFLILLLTLIIPTLIKNIGIFTGYFLLYLAFIQLVNHNSKYVIPISVGMILIILTITAIFLFGKSKLIIYLMSSVILSILIAVVIGIYCLKINNFSEINFEFSGAGVQPYISVFIAQVIFGVAGIILDEVIDITASMKEISETKADITQRELYSIGIKIGRDLIGPLVGILFFIIIANHFNEITVYLSNNYPKKELFQLIISSEIAQFFISVLGIALAVPITSYIFSRVLIREDN
ncbi:hypothetical protein RD055328_09070 [Companilactobacillus sp. RD055328]|uniref:YibE/F family protein n=1 Tax=Companilactobacillus sp. RD055328 TaxID=2916634 RepID=UPI001FC85593|nr:YibE/F family protein [Companilactobacillus sp. RD055328]GKQ42984.1 hypothetical protein RD055328_09070 [Companilactobacillus sp. RD055328]